MALWRFRFQSPSLQPSYRPSAADLRAYQMLSLDVLLVIAGFIVLALATALGADLVSSLYHWIQDAVFHSIL